MTIIRTGGKAHSAEYMRFVICERMHWDYYTYERQPVFFLEQLVIFMNQEALQSKDEANRMRGSATKKRGGGYSRG